jgi:acyl-CoA hydrolase
MASFDEAYRAKRISHEELISKMRPGDAMTLGIWLGQAVGVMRALGRYAKNIDPLYISISHATAEGEFLSQPNIRCQSSFLGPSERAARRKYENVFYVPTQFTDAYRAVRTNRPPDFFVRRVAPMDERGYFNFSLSSSSEFDAIRWYSEHSPDTRVVFEVNPHMPKVRGLPQFGNNELHLSQVDFIVEDDTPLVEFTTPAPTEAERAIAANVVRLIEDRATIQLGFGSIPMIIGKMLCDRKDLGIHSEMFCEAHLDLVEAGSVSNAYKGLYDGVSVATFALGDSRLVRWVGETPTVAMLPVEEINPVPVVEKVNNFTSIHNGLTVDQSGQVCAHCLGPETYSGLGGAFEFVYGAQHSPGGKSIICLRSTTTLKDGREVSNIVSRYEPGTRITIPEHCVDWVATEYGAVRLKFLNLEWRAAALTRLAHPRYRDQLTKDAIANGLRVDKLARSRRPPAHFFSEPFPG